MSPITDQARTRRRFWLVRGQLSSHVTAPHASCRGEHSSPPPADLVYQDGLQPRFKIIPKTSFFLLKKDENLSQVQISYRFFENVP